MTAEDFQDSLRTERHEDEAARQRQIDALDRALADEHEAGRPVVARLRAQRDVLAAEVVAWMDAWDETELAS